MNDWDGGDKYGVLYDKEKKVMTTHGSEMFLEGDTPKKITVATDREKKNLLARDNRPVCAR